MTGLRYIWLDKVPYDWTKYHTAGLSSTEVQSYAWNKTHLTLHTTAKQVH